MSRTLPRPWSLRSEKDVSRTGGVTKLQIVTPNGGSATAKQALARVGYLPAPPGPRISIRPRVERSVSAGPPPRILADAWASGPGDGVAVMPESSLVIFPSLATASSVYPPGGAVTTIAPRL